MYYTDERNVQIVIALLKAHGIHKVIASPGTSHLSFLGSIQEDPWFDIWSAIDERHAPFLAVGMATETEEPVVLTCTGSTASRNYLPALTEAYYRHVPVLAITAAQSRAYIGHLHPQFVDRTTPPRDAVKYDCYCPTVITDAQARDCELAVNTALLELKRHGGGPVHIDLEIEYNLGFNTKQLPKVRKISRFTSVDEFPKIPKEYKIVVYIGDHKKFSEKESKSLECFLSNYNAIAVCHATSSWHGSKRIVSSLVCSQGIKANPKYSALKPDLIIDIGGVANDYSSGYFHSIAPVWRVAEDGEVRDRFGSIANVFEMPESFFFNAMSNASEDCKTTSYYDTWKKCHDELMNRMPVLPFSNLWIGQRVIPNLPKDSLLFIGLSSTLQNWATFLQDTESETMSNVGTCGIDGCVSTFLGASLSSPQKLHFGVVGDLTFFYDLNSLGNRHIGNNVRLILVNNGCASLFHSPKHMLEPFTDVMDKYMAAGGHFGCKSPNLVRHYATDLGFEYLSASSKDEFEAILPKFLSQASSSPILLECFTTVDDERVAWSARKGIDNYIAPKTLAKALKGIMPVEMKKAIKTLIK